MRMRFSANYIRDTRAWVYNVSTPPSQSCWEALTSRLESVGACTNFGSRPTPLFPLPPLSFLLRGRKKCTLIGKLSLTILSSNQRKKFVQRPTCRVERRKILFETFQRRLIRTINKTMVDRWAVSTERQSRIEGSKSRLTRRRGPPRPEGKLFPRIVTGISYRRGHNLPWWCIVTGYGRSVAVERPPRKNDHRAPWTIRLMEKATAKDIDQFPEGGGGLKVYQDKRPSPGVNRGSSKMKEP